MKSFVIILMLGSMLSSMLIAAEAEIQTQPMFSSDFSAIEPGKRPPYISKGEVSKDSDGNCYLKLPKKSYYILNHSTLFYKYGGKNWKNYSFSFRFRYSKSLNFNAQFRGGGIGFTSKAGNYFNHKPKISKKAKFSTPLEAGIWHTVVITVKEIEMTMEIDGKKVLSSNIPDNKGVINFTTYQSLDLDDIKVTEIKLTNKNITTTMEK